MYVKALFPVMAAGIVFAGCSPTNNVDPSDAQVLNATPSPIVTASDIQQGIDQAAGAVQGTIDELAAGLPKTLTLEEVNSSGQVGVATLTQENNQTKVVLVVNGGNIATTQPAHIHTGNCPNPGEVLYTLTPITNGRSETVINENIESILASSEHLAINVHRAPSQLDQYTSCGNLKTSE